jgi:hypothetical protein
VGFSFLIALESLARCHLRREHTALVVSYNLEDAKEKILTARQIYEELPLAYQKRLTVDSKTELGFVGNGASGRLSRIISNPSKAPRGRKGDVYLDELAHYLTDREVYKGSTALILRSNGQMTGCSTPLGRRGIFWEIATEELRPYPHHTRQLVPWWVCRFFCTDVPRAAKEAPGMSTEERVRTFGTPAVIEQFDSLPLEDFQQEFECLFVDESYSFFPYELILPCAAGDLRLREDFTDVRIRDGRLVAGFDVGRTRDQSELVVAHQVGDRYTVVFVRSYDHVPFREQEADLRRLLTTLPIVRLSIDQNGIGKHLAENLAREFPQVVPEDPTAANKERWALDLKILMQQRGLEIPRNRDLIAQIHSIKRTVTAKGNVTFQAPVSRRGGHADKFWALALACQKERQTKPPPREVVARII